MYTRRCVQRVWLIASFVLLIPAAAAWKTYFEQNGLQKHDTPIDVLQPAYADYWRFLRAARRHVPSGSSYTIRGRNPDEETALFMISRGLYDGIDPRPATLFGIAQTGGGTEARFVLVYGTTECPAGIVLAMPVHNGMVCDRSGS